MSQINQSAGSSLQGVPLDYLPDNATKQCVAGKRQVVCDEEGRIFICLARKRLATSCPMTIPGKMDIGKYDTFATDGTTLYPARKRKEVCLPSF
jgi:hypothetical protein